MCKPAGPIDNYMRDNVPWTMLIKTLVHSSPQALAVCAQVARVTSFFLAFHFGKNRHVWPFAQLLQWVLVHLILFFILYIY